MRDLRGPCDQLVESTLFPDTAMAASQAARSSRLQKVDQSKAPEEFQARRSWRLRKHADYQRVYKASRKQFSHSMAFFFAAHNAESVSPAPRVGLTAGRVLGKAVERNRIKRRMREAVKSHLHLLPPAVDVVLHPRRSVLEVKFTDLSSEVERIFLKIAGAKPSVRS